MSDARALIWYVTSHGNGHAVRTCDILREVHRRHPSRRIVLVGDLPAAFLHNRLGTEAVRLRRARFDVGLVQHDSITTDLPASLHALRQLAHAWESLVRVESAWLHLQKAALVVCDIPGIPLESARLAGLPAVACGNFGWDFIYGTLARDDDAWRPFSERYAQAYRQADLLLRLPFHEPMSAFPRIEDVPVVARPGRDRRAEIAAAAGCDPSLRWVLLSFSTLAWDDAALARLEAMDDTVFLTLRPLEWQRRNFRALDRGRFPFTDALASCDCVLTKPGFGIVSECVVGRRPVVYADRPGWPEHPFLEEGLRRYARCRRIGTEELYAGDVAAAIDEAIRAPAPAETAPSGGAALAADRLESLWT